VLTVKHYCQSTFSVRRVGAYYSVAILVAKTIGRSLVVFRFTLDDRRVAERGENMAWCLLMQLLAKIRLIGWQKWRSGPVASSIYPTADAC